MRVNGIAYRSVWIEDGVVKMIDQRRLPFRFDILSLTTPQETAEAIRSMAVRGAGAIGVAAGYAMAQAALAAPAATFDATIAQAAELIRATRPTARDLFYAVDNVLAAMRSTAGVEAKRASALATAQRLSDENAEAGHRIGEVGQALFGSSTTVMTHCNAGWLAFADWGSALAPVYEAHRRGKTVHVYAMETRPRGQGAKLTMWELSQEGVPCTLLPDTAAASAMRRGGIDLIIVGADRVAANADVANKIGTYGLAVLARAHTIPFYVAAPTSTIDHACPSGRDIPIEERAEDEVLGATGVDADGRLTQVRTTPDGIHARNWAFDVTPAEYLAGILTERGMIDPTPEGIRSLREPAATAKVSSHA